MNVFIIPSWYPSEHHPHTGIFNKEQAEALAYIFPEHNFALSTWGSHDEDLLLWSRNHLKNVLKIHRFLSKNSSSQLITQNLIEYFTPTFTWSRKFFNGNIQGIIKANERHFKAFSTAIGKVDIIHAHSAYPAGWVAMILSEKWGIPYVITEHMTPFPFKSFLTKEKKLSHWLMKPFSKSSGNIVVSPMQKCTLEKWCIPNLIHVPNLTNENFFTPLTNLPKQPITFTFFTLCMMVPQKGIPVLLNAIKLFKANSLKGQFLIGGDGNHIDEYKHLADELQVQDRVQWLGSLDRISGLEMYQQCQAFVLPSLHENLPLVLLEAIACGKPIISTRCGGPESIINSTNGLLAEPGSSESLYKCLKQLTHNYHQYNEDKIRQDFCNRYSRKIVCNQIMEVYQEAIATFGH